MRTIGLIVNPVAGMGGSVGLKGTDGDSYARALEMGAEPVSPARTREFLSHITCRDEIRLLVAPGPMGADYAEAVGLDFEIVGSLTAQPAAEDTRRIAREMLQAGAELIAFAGGDGTARDIADAVDLRLPVIAIPSGVKVYSSVFAYSPRAAAELLDAQPRLDVTHALIGNWHIGGGATGPVARGAAGGAASQGLCRLSALGR